MIKIENWVTLENPITNQDLHKKLFQGLQNFQNKFKPNDIVYLFVLKKDEQNRRVFFSNHANWSKDEYVLVDKYKYHNFWSPTDAALAFAQTITERVIKLSGAT
ncbi:hypothetical protein [Sulfurimonas sp.]|jgi:hypothetical protein|uniref:hypothetical protein n=1 Tax=Sulfurimonas sp. TaxID=2022749 RepID=UPI002A3610E3|nr:hypothetical protein [Sulfurimonas sp.]MDY0122850.1 hypothetical protein [Sulfurimonas sp.]